ncbi:MAG: serpin family protein [Dysgonamonadaceae bacterium]|jgi:serpin B|nr:serpin family protein [Dysgonamonadaceae bacterium]
MKNLVLVLLALTGLFLSACDNDSNGESTFQEPIKINLSGSELQMANEGNAFAAKLFSAIYENEEEKENIVISPLSLNMALAMAWNGAGGETKQAIQKAMGMGDYPQTEVNAYFKKMREALLKTDPSVKLAIANSIWSRTGFPIKPNFYTINKEWYNAAVRELDFSAPSAPDIINQWCSDNTQGLIKEMIKGIPGDVVMYLINALYFKGEWSDKYGFVASETADALFYKENKQQESVKMMSQNSLLNYYSDEYVASTALPYGNGAFSMVFILPNDNIALNKVLAQLEEPNYWNKCLNPSVQADVNLYIPKFKFEYEKTLNETLAQLGMGIAFTDFADFSEISTIPLCISEVKQKACIEVNEEGSEAAAVTVVGYVVTSAQPSTPQKITFRADRPFLFAIRENSTGTVLFMGKIGDPK